ncbi:site-specific DNA-methyltransferase [Undibacterium pigrum]|uniref:site-specific DNA-methyltransferase (cytosine-N(4)-specific) n=1 Tax=Undibacterium pigrum TaxID=401470 RepID=A0A318JBU8_9BURK|nr:site-specific DNA-methyltransferase [Undibacterium pigrum]PXX44267.1 hypothetical protein DFR42_103537 [Undibacterium pigrum]
MDRTNTEQLENDVGGSAPQQSDQEYWSFQGRSKREFSHAYLQYPAMMVPQMQGEIIDHICAAFPTTRHVWDPFVGSGTSLGECMLRGLDFSGNDINPLAVLVSKTKRGPLHVQAIAEKATYLFERIGADKSAQIAVNFPGREKWFSNDASIQLSRIRRGVCSEPSLWARRFFWVALAETIRLTSNSRTSTFKLHIRNADDLQKERKDPLSVFENTLADNISHLSDFKDRLTENGLVNKGMYVGTTDIQLSNTTKLPSKFLRENKADLIITSPPYGDNQTTIPYGQYSYLPLNWIPLEDIDANATNQFLESTCAIDSMSLGGSKKGAHEKAASIREMSPTFCTLYDELGKKSDDAQKKVASFFYDLDTCIEPLLSRLKEGGHMVWTLGNRTVANMTVPLDNILLELFAARGAFMPSQFERTIHSKRMARRNNVSKTMTKETIIIMQKPLAHVQK